jgi:hypothetical protein
MSDQELIIVEPEDTSFPWERMEGEPIAWFMRFHDFLMQGPRRTIAATMRQNQLKTSGSAGWSAKAIQWNWHNRAEAYDLSQAQKEEDMRFEIMHTGLALEHHRVKTLKAIAEGEAEIVLAMQEHVKDDSIGTNESLTKRYAAMAAALHKSMEAIALEAGGRVRRVTVKRELRDFAIELARSEGYEEAVALRIADMVAEDKA